MAPSPVTPVVGPSTQVSGGTPVVALPANLNGGRITNPITAITVIYVDPTGAPAGQVAAGSTFALQPGQSWDAIPGQTTTTSVNAANGDNNHAFSAVYW